MNSLTHAGKSHDFTNTDELLSLPIVREYIDNPGVSKFGYNDKQLVAFVGNPPVMHIIGTLDKRVVLPVFAQSQGVKSV